MLSPVKIWRNQHKVRDVLNKKGIVISLTKVYIPPQGFENLAPYIVVIAELSDGRRFTAQMVDYENKHLRIGQKVLTVLRRTRSPSDEGIIPYGVKFKPL